MIKQTNLDFNTGMGMGCAVLLMLSIGGLSAGGVGFFAGLIFGICAMILGGLFDAATKGENQRKLNRLEFQIERMKMNAKDK